MAFTKTPSGMWSHPLIHHAIKPGQRWAFGGLTGLKHEFVILDIIDEFDITWGHQYPKAVIFLTTPCTPELRVQKCGLDGFQSFTLLQDITEDQCQRKSLDTHTESETSTPKDPA